MRSPEHDGPARVFERASRAGGSGALDVAVVRGAVDGYGYRSRGWDTGVGTIDLAIPKLCRDSYYPQWLLEPRRRAEQALVAVVAQCYVEGATTPSESARVRISLTLLEPGTAKSPHTIQILVQTGVFDFRHQVGGTEFRGGPTSSSAPGAIELLIGGHAYTSIDPDSAARFPPKPAQ